MGMVYSFYKIYSMDFVDKVFECTAKDIHDARLQWMKTEHARDYDLIAVNGVFCF